VLVVTTRLPGTQLSAPSHLTCEALITPLGMDEPSPALSWRLNDAQRGTRQTAYEVQVATTLSSLVGDRPDVWDSGRVASSQSVGVLYQGPALVTSKRYYWRVKVWDQEGRAYPPSDASWWETGLSGSKDWTRAKWIAYEDKEHRSIRDAHPEWITTPESNDAVPQNSDVHSYFRYKFDLPSGIRLARLHITGEDTVAVWVNGKQAAQQQPLPAWNGLPWKTYSVIDITQEVHGGTNALAVDVLRYRASGKERAPFSAALYVGTTDGKIHIFKTTRDGWKASRTLAANWTSDEFDDSAWNSAVAYPVEVGWWGPEPGNPLDTGPVPALRRTFNIAKPIASARLYATALGTYTLQLNGSTVGDQVLAPGWTDYRQRVIYQAYDVTPMLKLGPNAIGALLAPGWYSTPLTWDQQPNNYGNTPPVVKVLLRIVHPDGSVDWIGSDETWKADQSPIISAEIYNGETFDARLVQSGWDTYSFSDSSWQSVQLPQVPDVSIVWQYFQPIRVETVLTAKDITNPKPGIYVFDFGQNLAGVARLQAQGAAGTDVRLRFAEITNPDGTIYTDNLRTAKATDHFILSGRGLEEFQPSFTFHGFRYVEVSGLTAAPGRESVKAVVIHTDAPFTAELKTGSKMLNQLWSNIVWGQRSNFVGVPTDCPQRDERLGWSGDAQVFWRAAVYNMGLQAFSRKYAADLRGTQSRQGKYGIFAPGVLAETSYFGPGWSDAGVIIPWTGWIQYGDTRIVEQNWSAMEKYAGGIAAANPDFLWRNEMGIPFADWLSPEGMTASDLVATAYWAYDATLLAQMAHALGRTDDEQKYRRMFENIKAAFVKEYVHDDGSVLASPRSTDAVPAPGDAGKKLLKESQTGYVLALHMDLVPPELRAKAGDRLVKLLEANQWQLATGFLGTPYLLSVLSDTGHSDAAYRLLLGTQYPSWGYLVEHGATTMWERWNGDQKKDDPSMNSYNHYAYGAVADWIYRYSAGIDTVALKPGFQTIRLHPRFDSQLGQIDLSYESPYGTIRSAWKADSASATWELTIPPNASGLLWLSREESLDYSLDGRSLGRTKDVRALGDAGNEVQYEISPGTYRFTVKLHAQ